MRAIAIAVVCFGIGCAGDAWPQSAATTGSLANSLATAAGVPLGTAITDLVTKASNNTFVSGLQKSLATVSQPTTRDANITGPVVGNITRETVKGFLVRDIELDSRFEENIKRVLGQISIDSLIPKSPSGSGLTIPALKNLQIAVPGLPSINFGTGMTPSVAPTRSANLATASTEEELSNTRVWGGTIIPAEADVFRDSVAILGNNKLCSGTLVDGQTVVTAGHCFCEGVMEEVVTGTSILSTDRVRVIKEQSESFRPCDEVNHDPSGGDVALLKLERSLVATPKPRGGLPIVRASAAIRAVGFGHTEGAIGFKYQVNIVIASYQCDGTASVGIPDSQIYRCKSVHELVAAGLNRDTCGGDSGGGIYVFGPDNNIFFVGVTSRAVDPNGKCGPGGIYVLLAASPIREWLESKGVAF
jgi:Trypsin